jgi:hypothetical protein
MTEEHDPEMDRLLDGLSRVMEPAQIGRWLKQPNSAFDGSTPQEVVERGEFDRIWRVLYDLESGQALLICPDSRGLEPAAIYFFFRFARV